MAVKSLLNGVEDKNDYYKFDEEIMSSGTMGFTEIWPPHPNKNTPP